MSCNGCGRPVDTPRPYHCPELHYAPDIQSPVQPSTAAAAIAIEWENGVVPGSGGDFVSGAGLLLGMRHDGAFWLALAMQDDGALVEFRILTSITKMRRKVATP